MNTPCAQCVAACRLFFFVDYLELRNVIKVDDITPDIISNYVISICPKHEKSIASILTTLRVFLRFLYLHGFTERDLSLAVPKPTRYRYPAVPSTWEPAEVKRMLDAIDRGSPRGKRDYAILLLVAKLGMRVSNIKALKLFKSCSIVIAIVDIRKSIKGYTVAIKKAT